MFLQLLFTIGRQTGRLKDIGAEKGIHWCEDNWIGKGSNLMGADLMAIRESDQPIGYSETVGPITWGRGWRKYAADKGNTSRI